MAKEAKEPQTDFEQSMYRIEGGGYGFPSVAIKSAMVTAVTSISGVTKVAARQAFRVVGEQALVKGAHPGLIMRQNLIRILGSEPEMREDMVRIGMGTADIRYRAQFLPWCMRLKIGFNKNLLSGSQIVNLLNVAGFGVGIGEWRSSETARTVISMWQMLRRSAISPSKECYRWHGLRSTSGALAHKSTASASAIRKRLRNTLTSCLEKNVCFQQSYAKTLNPRNTHFMEVRPGIGTITILLPKSGGCKSPRAPSVASATLL